MKQSRRTFIKVLGAGTATMAAPGMVMAAVKALVPDHGALAIMGDEGAVIGKFILLWRGNEKQVANLHGYCDSEGGRRIEYRLSEGADRGEEYTARFDAEQQVLVFNTEAGAIRGKDIDIRELLPRKTTWTN